MALEEEEEEEEDCLRVGGNPLEHATLSQKGRIFTCV
jgi:hypothetical protein